MLPCCFFSLLGFSAVVFGATLHSWLVLLSVPFDDMDGGYLCIFASALWHLLGWLDVSCFSDTLGVGVGIQGSLDDTPALLFTEVVVC